jgi:hypothetical protein
MIEEQKNKKVPLFYEAIEYFDRNDTQESLITEGTNQLENLRSNTTLLRDEMLNELNNLKDIFDNNPDLKLKALSKKERERFSKFIKFYQVCPICYQYNHYRNLKKFYFDDSKKELKDKLIKIMDLKNKKFNNINIRFGIPCCNCYKKLMSD